MLWINRNITNPLTACAEFIGFFTQLLPHSVPPFKHDMKRVDLHFVKSEGVNRVSETQLQVGENFN